MAETFNIDVNLNPGTEEQAMHALQVWLHGAKKIGAEEIGVPKKISFVVKNDKGDPVGGLLARLQMKILYIESAWVLPELKKTGIGKLLQEKVYHFAKESRCEYLLATTYDFYDAIGYLAKNDPEVETFAEIKGCPAPYSLFFLKRKFSP